MSEDSDPNWLDREFKAARESLDKEPWAMTSDSLISPERKLQIIYGEESRSEEMMSDDPVALAARIIAAMCGDGEFSLNDVETCLRAFLTSEAARKAAESEAMRLNDELFAISQFADGNGEECEVIARRARRAIASAPISSSFLARLEEERDRANKADDLEEQLWKVIDRDGLENCPSDIVDAVAYLKRQIIDAEIARADERELCIRDAQRVFRDEYGEKTEEEIRTRARGAK